MTAREEVGVSWMAVVLGVVISFSTPSEVVWVPTCMVFLMAVGAGVRTLGFMRDLPVPVEEEGEDEPPVSRGTLSPTRLASAPPTSVPPFHAVPPRSTPRSTAVERIERGRAPQAGETPEDIPWWRPEAADLEPVPPTEDEDDEDEPPAETPAPAAEPWEAFARVLLTTNATLPLRDVKAILTRMRTDNLASAEGWNTTKYPQLAALAREVRGHAGAAE